MADVNFLVVQKHTIDSLDSGFRGLRGLIMNKSITFRSAMFVSGNFTGQDIAECCKSVMKGLFKT